MSAHRQKIEEQVRIACQKSLDVIKRDLDSISAPVSEEVDVSVEKGAKSLSIGLKAIHLTGTTLGGTVGETVLAATPGMC